MEGTGGEFGGSLEILLLAEDEGNCNVAVSFFFFPFVCRNQSSDDQGLAESCLLSRRRSLFGRVSCLMESYSRMLLPSGYIFDGKQERKRADPDTYLPLALGHSC